MTSHEAFADRLWSAVTPRTRVIFLSHITSPTALDLSGGRRSAGAPGPPAS